MHSHHCRQVLRAPTGPQPQTMARGSSPHVARRGAMSAVSLATRATAYARRRFSSSAVARAIVVVSTASSSAISRLSSVALVSHPSRTGVSLSRRWFSSIQRPDSYRVFDGRTLFAPLGERNPDRVVPPRESVSGDTTGVVSWLTVLKLSAPDASVCVTRGPYMAMVWPQSARTPGALFVPPPLHRKPGNESLSTLRPSQLTGRADRTPSSQAPEPGEGGGPLGTRLRCRRRAR